MFVAWIYYAWTASPDDIGASLYWEAYFWINTLLQVLGVLTGGLVDWRRKAFGRRRKMMAALPISVLLIGVGIGLSASQLPAVLAQEAAAGSIQGISEVLFASGPAAANLLLQTFGKAV